MICLRDIGFGGGRKGLLIFLGGFENVPKKGSRSIFWMEKESISIGVIGTKVWFWTVSTSRSSLDCSALFILTAMSPQTIRTAVIRRYVFFFLFNSEFLCGIAGLKRWV